MFCHDILSWRLQKEIVRNIHQTYYCTSWWVSRHLQRWREHRKKRKNGGGKGGNKVITFPRHFLTPLYIYLIGIHFALWSDGKHWKLLLSPLKLRSWKETQSESNYSTLRTTLKNQLCGVNERHIKPKIVQNNAKGKNPDPYFVRLFNNYKCLCSSKISSK